jgi:hypothetical protein
MGNSPEGYKRFRDAARKDWEHEVSRADADAEYGGGPNSITDAYDRAYQSNRKQPGDAKAHPDYIVTHVVNGQEQIVVNGTEVESFRGDQTAQFHMVTRAPSPGKSAKVQVIHGNDDLNTYPSEYYAEVWGLTVTER